MGKEVTKMYALFPRKKRMGWRKALRGLMQCFAWTLAKLCVGTCNALRLRWAKKGIEIVCPILDKRKGRKDSPHGAL